MEKSLKVNKYNPKFFISKELVIKECLEKKILLTEYPQYINVKEVALAAIKGNISNYEFISKKLQSDKDIIIETMKIGGKYYPYIPKKYRNNKEILFLALENAGHIAIAADKELLENRDIVKEMVLKRGTELISAKRFLKDKELIILAFENVIKNNANYVSLIRLLTADIVCDNELVENLLKLNKKILFNINANFLNKELLIKYSDYIKESVVKIRATEKKSFFNGEEHYDLVMKYEREEILLKKLGLQENIASNNRVKRRI